MLFGDGKLGRVKDYQFITLEKDIIVYKKAKATRNKDRSIHSSVSLILEMIIPKGAIIYTSHIGLKGRKMRASCAIPVAAYGVRRIYLGSSRKEWSCDIRNGNNKELELFLDDEIFFSRRGRTYFRYEIGKLVEPKNKFCLHKEECASGIHFFRTRKEAMDW